MWWGRAKSPRQTFSLSNSSFKDIQSLCAEDDRVGPNTCTKAQLPSPSRVGSVFHRVRIATAALRSLQPHPPPSSDNRVVVYLTSLRVVRKTFDDCHAVQSILRGFRLSVDERDLSMHPGFLDELKSSLGRRSLPLPRVFVGGRYLGGADEIRHLHESGELKRILDGLPRSDPSVCPSCGGLRFLLCSLCNGSHKCFSDKGRSGGFRSCSLCNENGLVRCPHCCSS